MGVSERVRAIRERRRDAGSADARGKARLFDVDATGLAQRRAAQCSSNGVALRRDHAAAPCATDRPISGTRHRERDYRWAESNARETIRGEEPRRSRFASARVPAPRSARGLGETQRLYSQYVVYLKQESSLRWSSPFKSLVDPAVDRRSEVRERRIILCDRVI